MCWVAVNLGWLAGAHQAVLSLLLLSKTRRESNIKLLWVNVREGDLCGKTSYSNSWLIISLINQRLHYLKVKTVKSMNKNICILKTKLQLKILQAQFPPKFKMLIKGLQATWGYQYFRKSFAADFSIWHSRVTFLPPTHTAKLHNTKQIQQFPE